MARIDRFEDIQGWRKARELTKAVYEVSSQGSFAKDFALKNQIRDACISIMSNIAEFDQLYRLAESTIRLTGGFMSYLRQSEMRGSKFKRNAGIVATLNAEP